MSYRYEEILKECMSIHEERRKIYEKADDVPGSISKALFPGGISLLTNEDFHRYSMLITIAAKLKRYSNNFSKGGHKDSLMDIINYCAMLIEQDEES